MKLPEDIATGHDQWIEIVGATQNNLKNITFKIPKNRFTVITGVSGSGKSSLAFEVIHGEGRRRYFGNLSAHAKKYLGKLENPRVERIKGLTPTIAISQEVPMDNPRSTVGTLTGVYDNLRLLFARLGSGEGDGSFLNRSLFSFNSLEGACPKCRGLGVVDRIEPQLLIGDENKTIRQGAFKITNPKGYIIYSQVTMDALDLVLQAHGFSVDIPWRKLSSAQKKIVLNGSDIIKIPYGKHTLESRMKWSGITAKPREEGVYKGILPVMQEILNRDRNPNILRYAKTVHCPECRGNRLNPQALSVRVHGYTIMELCCVSITELSDILAGFSFVGKQQLVASAILEQVERRLALLSSLGLSYLTLSRLSGGLSGGEMQRIRLARQVLSGLRNITYILDEPATGVHPENSQRITDLLKRLVELGNTVVAVAHDAWTMIGADWIVEVGPAGGNCGGEILFSGTITDFVVSNHPSPTRNYLQGRVELSPLESAKTKDQVLMSLTGAEINNLQNIDVCFQRNQLNVVTGVSGAGKSSLVKQTLVPLLQDSYHQQLHGRGKPKLGGAGFKKTVVVDRKPIGRTARSNPATYTGLYDLIRSLYALLPAAKELGFNRGTFSFNVKGGACSTCQGAGSIETGMHFLGNVSRRCSDCGGKRFGPPVLGITFKDKNIADILDLTVDEARAFFVGEKKISHHLLMLVELGLGYLKLGQPTGTLSGGEAQRIRLARELIKGSVQNCLYILDEPSAGLHFQDIRKLFLLFERLLKKGSTLVLIEHNQELIRCGHHIIDLGPGGGDQGGGLVYQGDLSGLLANTASSTGRMLSIKREVLSEDKRNKRNKTNLTETSLYGVSTHNLKSVDVTIPDCALTVITGKSGSGKTSLAFDTLCVEAQNRFTESFPSQAVVARYSQARFKKVSGLCPVVAISQHNRIRDPRSTLATVTGILTHYRLMFSRFGICKENKPLPIAGHFSFNNISGACSHCDGLGTSLTGSLQSLFSRLDLPISPEACANRKTVQFYVDPDGQYMATLHEAGRKLGFDYSLPMNELSKEAIQVALFGSGDAVYKVTWLYKRGKRTGAHGFEGAWQGLVPLLLDEYHRKHARGKGEDIRAWLLEETCSACGGARLKPEILRVTFGGMNLGEWLSMDVHQSLNLLRKIRSGIGVHGIPENFASSQEHLLNNIINKLSALAGLGLAHLSLDRRSASLSGGEMQRVLLANQQGGELTGITYILDEPSVGLHGEDIKGLVGHIQNLTAMGNTVVCVEHNLAIIRAADHLIELGPHGGEAGGYVIAQGPVSVVADSPESLIGTSLNRTLELPHQVIEPGESLHILRASCHNLKNISVRLLKNRLNLITGVSGSGKTTLMREVIYPSIMSGEPVHCSSIQGLSGIDEAVWLGREGGFSRAASTPATYLGLFDEIRRLFGKLPKAKELGLSASHFSFNSRSGQCPVCKGAGEERVSLDFISDVSCPCESCAGSRYRPEVLSVKFQDHSISEVLGLSFFQAAALFVDKPKIWGKLDLICRMGLGYLPLGQASHTLSGGEAQRVKVAKDLLSGGGENSLYLLDEPGRGLHVADLDNLFDLFELLLERGNTLVVVDHNPHLIGRANWVIDLGPGAGEQGGNLLYQGDLSGMIAEEKSVTGVYLSRFSHQPG